MCNGWVAFPGRRVLNELKLAQSASAYHEKAYLIGAEQAEGWASVARIRNTDGLPSCTIESSCAGREC